MGYLFILPSSSSSSLHFVVVVLLLLFPRCRVEGNPSSAFARFRPHHSLSLEDGANLRPSPLVFKTQNNTEQKAQVGTTSVLHCVAYHVGENTVSWIRRRDYHLLTVGSLTYSSDQRFQVRYVKQENDWQLHIQYVQVRDDGVYECQVSSHPPVSLLTTLHVAEATSEVLGGPEKYVRVGSSLRLVCVLKDNTEPPDFVFWYHGPHMINYHATREVRVEQKGSVSILYLNQVRASDSGNYTCAPSKARPAHILIHVLKGGETPAAIHSGAVSKEGGVLLSCLLLLQFFLQVITLRSSPCLLPTSHHLQRAPNSSKQGLRGECKEKGGRGEGEERGGGGGGRREEDNCLLIHPPLPTLPSGGRSGTSITGTTKDEITS